MEKNMKILICGASGFIGRHLTISLRQAGHTVIRGVRNPTAPDDMAVDFAKDTAKEIWLPRLTGIDAVINAVGVLRDSPQQPMQLLHEQTPLALFAACQETGIKRIVQITALGIEDGIETPYFQTRRATEDYLNTNFSEIPFMVRPAHHEQNVQKTVRPELVEGQTNSIRFLILRPSVIYGEDGVSAKMFRLQASLPVHCLPMGGKQKLQPVHIDDICEAVSHWLADADAISQTVSCVGLEATDMRGMLDSYRKQLNYAPALHINVPSALMAVSAKLGDYIPASPLCSDTLTMLNAGNTGNSEAFAKLLGRSPRSYRTFIAGDDRHANR
jgi:uncharacterized protein YbjT (DUF2867 family)